MCLFTSVGCVRKWCCISRYFGAKSPVLAFCVLKSSGTSRHHSIRRELPQ